MLVWNHLYIEPDETAPDPLDPQYVPWHERKAALEDIGIYKTIVPVLPACRGTGTSLQVAQSLQSRLCFEDRLRGTCSVLMTELAMAGRPDKMLELHQFIDSSLDDGAEARRHQALLSAMSRALHVDKTNKPRAPPTPAVLYRLADAALQCWNGLMGLKPGSSDLYLEPCRDIMHIFEMAGWQQEIPLILQQWMQHLSPDIGSNAEAREQALHLLSSLDPSARKLAHQVANIATRTFQHLVSTDADPSRESCNLMLFMQASADPVSQTLNVFEPFLRGRLGADSQPDAHSFSILIGKCPQENPQGMADMWRLLSMAAESKVVTLAEVFAGRPRSLSMGDRPRVRDARRRREYAHSRPALTS